MKYIILVLAVVGGKFFFSILSILGLNYEGSADSPAYMIYTVAISMLVVVIYAFRLLRIGGIRKIEGRLFLVPLGLLLWFLLETFFSGEPSDEALKTGGFFLLWSLPAMLCGFCLAQNQDLSKSFKYFELVGIFFTLSGFASVVLPFLSGSGFETVAGASYQTMSYIAAIAFGLNLNFLFLGKSPSRFKFANTKTYQVIGICVLPFQLASVVIPGGRGATVLVLLYILLIPLISYGAIEGRNKNRMLFVLGALFLIGVFYLPAFLIGNDVASTGLERAFQFLGSDGQLDWEGSSGRDVIYFKALSLISERPLLGYGLFGFSEYLGAPYAHNVVLDLLLSGGLVLLLMVVAMFFLLVVRTRFAIRTDEKISIIVVLLIYALVSLMFSGTFLVAPELWFSVFLLFAWRANARLSP